MNVNLIVSDYGLETYASDTDVNCPANCAIANIMKRFVFEPVAAELFRRTLAPDWNHTNTAEARDKVLRDLDMAARTVHRVWFPSIHPNKIVVAWKIHENSKLLELDASVSADVVAFLYTVVRVLRDVVEEQTNLDIRLIQTNMLAAFQSYTGRM